MAEEVKHPPWSYWRAYYDTSRKVWPDMTKRQAAWDAVKMTWLVKDGWLGWFKGLLDYRIPVEVSLLLAGAFTIVAQWFTGTTAGVFHLLAMAMVLWHFGGVLTGAIRNEHAKRNAEADREEARRQGENDAPDA